MINEASILCAELRHTLGVHIRPREMERALTALGMTLAGPEKPPATEAEIEQLGHNAF